ncbi:MAG: SusC/RagA family TonB-linked outer membrane protein [Prevotella sp.]|jgi:TonB-linked SusC/RagA family outer membrane protein|nr:SusC/RagA family TonB-linked outer membrane protein [Prevotella sp.]
MKKIDKIFLAMCLLMMIVVNVTAQQVQKSQQPVQTKQMITISGTVYEEGGRGESLPGATVVVRDAKTKKAIEGYGIMSDNEGRFNIKVPVGSELYFSYLQFKPKTYLARKDAANVKIYMEPDEEGGLLPETVVVGYQKISKAASTSSVFRVNTEDMVTTPVANVVELLQGRVPGMDISMNNGLPGAQGQINIRGISDISVVGNDNDGYDLSSATPLFVVDGIPQRNVSDYDSQGLISGSGISPLSSIPFEDIDNIQVLKDAMATSLYGSEGAYGVILIETKKGNSPTPQIQYSGNFTVSTPPRLREVAVGNTERYLRMNQILQNDTSRYNGYRDIMLMPSLADSLNPYWNNNTDWQGQFYRVTYNHSHNLRVSGGDQRLNYKVNGNYYTEKGIVKSTDFNRYSLGSQVNFKPNDRFSIGIDTKFTFTTNNTGSGNAVSQQGVASSASASSLLPPPSLYSASLSALQAFSVKNQSNENNYSVTANMTYKLPFNINWQGTVNYSFGSSESESFTPAILSSDNYKAITKNSSGSSQKIYLRTMASRGFNLYLINLNLTAGIEYEDYKSTGNTVQYTGLPNDYILGPIGYGKGSGTAKVSSNQATFSLIFNPSFNLRTPDMDLGDKYIFTPTLRPELSSIYGEKTKYIIQPSMGFRWNIFKEPFMKRFTKISSMAFRASWGRVVKYSANRYTVWGTYDIDPNNTYGGDMYIPIDFNNLPSARLEPVTTTTWNFGHENSLFKNQLRTEIDLYYKQVDHQLSDITLPDHSGFDKMKSAETSIVNYGLEVAFTGMPIPNKKDVSLMAGLNFSINKDVVTKLPNEARQILNQKASMANRLGMNTTSMLMYVNKGVYATDEDVPVDPATGKRLRVGGNNTSEAYFKAGDPIWVDINGDYVIDENDKVVVGDAAKRLTGGLWINFSYKNFSINTSTSFVLGRDVVNEVLAARFDAYTTPLLNTVDKLKTNASLAPIEKYNFWTETNRYNATYPNPFDYIHAAVIDPFRADQTLFVEDGSYFKINSISVAYRIPKSWIKYMRVRSVSLKGSVNNIYTFSAYSGISPESVNGLGRDKSGGYPNRRTWTMGVVIDL